LKNDKRLSIDGDDDDDDDWAVTIPRQAVDAH
jgi:hypothetical protein